MTKPIYGCIEAGGTKFVLGIGTGPDAILETTRIETGLPDETLAAATAWLAQASHRHGALQSIGIASFGPLELDRAAPHWGHVTSTPKPHWSNTDVAGPFANAFGVPVGFDTDVNGAGLAEARWGAGKGQRISVYVTIGTGIGGGAIVEGRPLHGVSHPEMGHIRVPRHPADSGFAGICPYHGDCLEGVANGPAVIARWGASLSDLPADHIAHEIIAFYIAQLAVSLQAMMEPGKIILGGGVMATPGLLERVRAQAAQIGAGYFKGNAEQVIVAPMLGDQAGLLGALALAMDAAQND